MISYVIPVYNEEESLDTFFKEFKESAKKIPQPHEIIFVDDGSTDGTLDILLTLRKKDPTVRIFSFRKNQGKAEALTLGFQKARGDYIITLDADLQDQPDEVKKLFEVALEKWDVVSGWRKNRQDKWYKIIASKVFNYFAKVFWGLKLHDYNCGMKVYTNEAAKSLQLYGGLHRFIPLIAHSQGFSVTEVPVVHQKRKFGRSKYGFSKLWKDLPDMLTMLFLVRYSKRPLHFFGFIGMIMVTVGLVILLYLSIIHFYGESIGSRPLLLFGVLLVLSGMQTFFTGFIAELLTNVSQKNDMHFPLKYTTEKEK